MSRFIRKLVITYHLNWSSTVTLFSGIALIGFITSPTVILIFVLGAVSTIFPEIRRLSLFAACLVNIFLMNSYLRSFDIGPLHLVPFFIFNSAFILLFDKFAALRRHYFLLMFALIMIIGLIQGSLGKLGISNRDAILASTPIVANIWAYMNYIKLPIRSLTFIERVVWLRPFWYRWVIPYGSNREISDAIDGPVTVNVADITRALRILALITIGMFFFENLVFEKNEVFPRVDWIPHLLNYPLVYRDGYAAAIEAAGTATQLQRSLYYLAVQSAATVQFLFIIALYSTAAITTARFAGFKIDLHVRDFWNAKNFGDFYFRTNHHFSLLIRNHLLPKLSRIKVPLLWDSMRQALVVAAGVFVVSSLSMYVGRGLFLGGNIHFEDRLATYFSNYHYSTLTALVCAVHVFIRKKSLAPSGRVLALIWRVGRPCLYFLVFQFTLIFGFHFLKTTPETKLQFAADILKLFQFDTYF
ncbi:MAG: hypothetical protein J0L82_00025 [Deltaproteobacteria bacterium]|jgi:hypothetical protein|nr:hypothetical protein [Deltaproteobacteria bacterium]